MHSPMPAPALLIVVLTDIFLSPGDGLFLWQHNAAGDGYFWLRSAAACAMHFNGDHTARAGAWLFCDPSLLDSQHSIYEWRLL